VDNAKEEVGVIFHCWPLGFAWLVLSLTVLFPSIGWAAERLENSVDSPSATVDVVEVVEIDELADDFSQYLHPWSSPHSLWASSELMLYVPVYDNQDISPGIGYEISAFYALIPPFSLGLSLAQSVSDIDETGALLDGSLVTGQMMFDGRLDIPLGKSWMPMLSFSAGIGFLHVDPKLDTHVKNDLYALGLEVERETQIMLNLRLKAELKIPLVRERNTFLTLGISREQAEGTIRYRHIDIATEQTVFSKRADMKFNRTSFYLGLNIYF
jgi:hypothetical protein